MTRKSICFILTVALLLGVLSGCSVIGKIFGNVAEAAKEELEKQVKEVMESYKVEVVEIKTAFGKLNGDDDRAMQFFYAALIRSDSEESVKKCLDAIKPLFEDAGYKAQTGKEVESDYLVHKTISFNTEIDGSGYYLVYAYNSSLTGKLFK